VNRSAKLPIAAFSISGGGVPRQVASAETPIRHICIKRFTAIASGSAKLLELWPCHARDEG